MKPIIGISAHFQDEHKYELHHDYVQAIQNAGGLPIILPTGYEEDVLQMAQSIHGLLLTGHLDIDPFYYEEEPHPKLGPVSPAQDSIELALAKQMIALNKPVLGVCRGLQIINIAFGGNVFQDLQSITTKPLMQHMQQSPKHHPTHYVDIKEDSLLKQLVSVDRLKVNSFHHQAAKYVPKTLRISGVTNDGVIEAIESKHHRFIMGVQWQLEALANGGDLASRKIISKFIEKAKVH